MSDISKLTIYRNIFWRNDFSKDADGKRFANIHLLVGYYSPTISRLNELADFFRESFPEAPDTELNAGKITKSTYCYGFTLLTWNTHLPEGEYPGWSQYEDRAPDYCFS